MSRRNPLPVVICAAALMLLGSWPAVAQERPADLGRNNPEASARGPWFLAGGDAEFGFAALETSVREDLGAVQLLADIDRVTDRRPGEILVVVTNTAAVPVVVREVVAYGGRNLQVCAIKNRASGEVGCVDQGERVLEPEQQLEPSHVAVYQFEVRPADDRPRAGTQQVAFTVELHTLTDGSSAMLVESLEIQVGVFGEQELLSPLGVPSFLLVPGLLVLASATLLWRRGESSGEARQESMRVLLTDPVTWATAITGSILIGLLYWFLVGIDLRDGYNSDDIVRVWLLALVVGLLVGGAARARRSWKHPVVHESDSPERVVTKAARWRGSATASSVKVRNERGLLVDNRRPDQHLISPMIHYETTGSRTGTRWRNAVDSDSLRAARRQLWLRRVLPGKITLEWHHPEGWITGPRWVDPAEYSEGPSERLFYA